MKILLTIILSFMISIGTLQEKVDNFNATCNDGYDYYFDYLEKDDNTYYLNVKVGCIGDEVSYSLCFLSEEAKDYTLTIIQDNKTINLSFDDRGDYFIYRLVTEKSFQLGIWKENNLTDNIVIERFSNLDLLTKETIKTGNGKGLSATSIKNNNVYMPFALAIIFSVIIIVCIIIILILSITKKGWFNKNNRINSVTQYSSTEVEVVEETYEEPKNNVKYESKEEYHFEEDDRDISILLREKGFNTDYSNLEMTEKNQIMLELMRMKDFKEISESEYRSEVIKLWS